MLTFEQIKELIQLVGDRDLGRFKLERSGFVLEIEARPEIAAAPAAPAPPSPAAPPPSAPASAPAADAAPAEAAEAPEPEGDHTVSSPIVGTFYSAPAPDADPFVKEGDRVEEGQVLCIIEAMKLMNEIEADATGTLVRIFPKNAQPVEYGEPLFSIQTS